MIEVEKKAYLNNPKVLENIKQIAEYQGYVEKQDTYYGPKEKKQVNAYQDSVFRIRKEKGRQILSFKNKSFLDKTEVNQENEIDVSSIDKKELELFFDYLGYKSFIDKIKKSHIYIMRRENQFPVTIEHNNIEPLGEFIEIEILTGDENDAPRARDLIDQIFNEIGITETDVENRYYIDLLSGRQK